MMLARRVQPKQRDCYAKLEDQHKPEEICFNSNFQSLNPILKLTFALSAELAPCTQIPGLTRHPKLVETHLMFNPSAWKSLQNCCVNCTLGLSSATTTQVLTQAKFMFRCFSV
jgi:hypothetical protein